MKLKKQISVFFVLIAIMTFTALTGVNEDYNYYLPRKMIQSDYNDISLFMTSHELELLNSCYTKNGDTYRLTVSSEDELASIGSKLWVPIYMTYKNTSVTISDFRKKIAIATNSNVIAIASMSLDEIVQDFELDLNLADNMMDDSKINMCYIYQQLMASGRMESSKLQDIRASEMKNVDSEGYFREFCVELAVRYNENAKKK